MKEKYHKYLIFGLTVLGAFTLGFMAGSIYTMNLIIYKLVALLEASGVDLKLPAQQIADLIVRYIGWMS